MCNANSLCDEFKLLMTQSDGGSFKELSRYFQRTDFHFIESLMRNFKFLKQKLELTRVPSELNSKWNI